MAKKKDSVEYTIEIPKQNKYFFLIRKFMEDVLSAEKLSEAERDEIILAVNEACDKMVRLDAEKGRNLKVGIKVRVTPKKITVALHYKGATILPNYFKTFSEEQVILESVKSRIGDYLMEKATDEVQITASKKKGHNVKIVKYRRK